MAETCDNYKFPRRLVYHRQGYLIRDNSIYICPYCAKEYTKANLYDNGIGKGNSFKCYSYNCNELLVAP